MSDRVFRDHYISAESWNEQTEDIHGPFVISQLRPTDFRRVSFRELEADVERVLDGRTFTSGSVEENESAPSAEPQQRSSVMSHLAPFRGEQVHCHVLDVDLDDERLRHDLSDTLWVFREFVMVDAAAHEIHQLVLGFD